MLTCYEGSVGLILDTPYVLLALWMARSLEDFSQSQAKTKFVHGQHSKHGTAEPFHFLHMGPMSDVTMLRRLCGADFGHAMPSLALLLLGKSLADFSQSQANKSRLFVASTPRKTLLDHFISSIWVQ